MLYIHTSDGRFSSAGDSQAVLPGVISQKRTDVGSNSLPLVRAQREWASHKESPMNGTESYLPIESSKCVFLRLDGRSDIYTKYINFRGPI